jgi:hypothetical protein
VPRSLTAVLLPAAQVRSAVQLLGPATLQVGEDLPGLEDVEPVGQWSLLLVPDVDGPGRGHLLRVLEGRQAYVGPARPWTDVRSSYLRAVRTVTLVGPVEGNGSVDTEEHLTELVVGADPESLADLRARVLEPLADLRPATAQRLAETLRSWLLHQGRRDDVAADLHVHAQTVRYRMGQVRERYGDRLDDPDTVMAVLLALHGPSTRTAAPPVDAP